MNSNTLLFIYKALRDDSLTNLQRLNIIDALSESNFPIDTWEQMGIINLAINFINQEYYHGYCVDRQYGAYHDLLDFCYCLYDICEGQGQEYIERPWDADIEDLYKMVDEMN